MKTITAIWVGQLISGLGSSMVKFGIIMWVYIQTGNATSLSQMAFATLISMVIFSPFAGFIVDQSNRKHMMMLGDIGGITGSIAILVLLHLGILQIWHLYIVNIIIGITESFKFPAYSVIIAETVPQKHYARVHAMFLLAAAISTMLGSFIVGKTLKDLGLEKILTFDIITFIFALTIIMFSTIPQLEQKLPSSFSMKYFLYSSFNGVKHIIKDSRLLALVVMSATCAFFYSLLTVLLPVMVLARTNGDTMTYGLVQVATGFGTLLGALSVTILGGTRKYIDGVLLGLFGFYVGVFALGTGLGMKSWIIGAVVLSFFFPVIDTSNQAIWQTITPPSQRGQIFAMRRMLTWIAGSLGAAVSGPLADRVFEPIMNNQVSGSSMLWFKRFVAEGHGSGIAVIFLCVAIVGILLTIIQSRLNSFRSLRSVVREMENVKGEMR